MAKKNKKSTQDEPLPNDGDTKTTGFSIDQTLPADELRRLQELVDRSFDVGRYPDPQFSITEEQAIIIRTEVSGLSLDLGVRRYNDLIKWGATISASEIRLHDPKKSGLFCVAFLGCRLLAVLPQEAPNWSSLHWIDCSFEGIFRFCCFGETSNIRCFQNPLTLMQRCSFANARLDDCAFMNTDPNELLWPRSPHVLVYHPHLNCVAIQNISPHWPLQGFLQNLALADEDLAVRVFSFAWLQQNLTPADFGLFLTECQNLDFITVVGSDAENTVHPS